MHLDNLNSIYAGCIEVYDNVFDNCEKIIEISENKNNWKDASIFKDEFSNGTAIEKSIRSNEYLGFDQFSYEVEEEIHSMCKTVWQYSNEYAKKYKFSFFSTEPIQILKYSPGQRYVDHHDYSPNVPRVCSALLYLNDVEKGGETEFVNFGIKISPKRGRLVIFPSNYAYQHAALSPKTGTKYVSVFWMRG